MWLIATNALLRDWSGDLSIRPAEEPPGRLMREQTGYEILRLGVPPSPSFFGAIIGPLTKQFPPGTEKERERRKSCGETRDANPMSPGTSCAGKDYAHQILRGNTCTKLGVRNSVLYTGRRAGYQDTLICDTTMRNSSGFPSYSRRSRAYPRTVTSLYRTIQIH